MEINGKDQSSPSRSFCSLSLFSSCSDWYSELTGTYSLSTNCGVRIHSTPKMIEEICTSQPISSFSAILGNDHTFDTAFKGIAPINYQRITVIFVCVLNQIKQWPHKVVNWEDHCCHTKPNKNTIYWNGFSLLSSLFVRSLGDFFVILFNWISIEKNRIAKFEM